MPTWAIALLLVAGGNASVLGLAVLRCVRARRALPAPARHVVVPDRVATVSRLRWAPPKPAPPGRSRHRPGA